MDNLSIAMQNYLETIFDLSRKSINRDQDPQSTLGAGVRVSDIAAHLDVSKASVNNAMNVLAKLGFVSNEKYQEIYMTDLGKETAALLEGKHKIIKTLFTDIIGIPENTANDDACAIEHIISHEAVQQIHEYLIRQGINVIEE
jgi:DtxR family transcriptional regulator, Mn-dependent transcriptional regulator